MKMRLSPIEADEKWSYARRTKHAPAKAGVQTDNEAYTVRRSEKDECNAADGRFSSASIRSRPRS